MQLDITDKEGEALAWAVQWAGHFATLAGDCQPGGPAFSSIAPATVALERAGLRIYHSRATREAINSTGGAHG